MADTSDLNTISKLQLHYWFSDKTHTMDALVHNKCERELLEIAKVVAKLCGVAITVETEPSGKGGLKDWLTIAAKSPTKTRVSKIVMVNTLVVACVATPAHASILHLVDALLSDLMADEQLNELQRRQLEQLKADTINQLPLLEQNSIIKKRRSNFYDLLRKYQKVKSVSVALTDGSKKPIIKDQLIVRDDFKKFIVSSGLLTPQIVENAQIEIISPVLVKGRHKWKGMFNGLPISFTMKSEEFMAMVQLGKVEFKSGSSITCRLEIERKINGVGVETIIGYNIIGVGSYSENGKVETAEGKQKPKETTLSKKQLDLFG